jgi:hypothetical protein
MRGEKSITMLPEERPDLLEVGFGQSQTGEFFAPKECESAFAMCRGQTGEARFHFKKEHQPVCLAAVAVLAHYACEMEIRRLDFDAEFFPGFAARRGVRRLATGSVELSAAGTPKAKIRRLRSFHQQHTVPFVETIEQRRNLVRKGRHNYFTKAA